MSHSPKLMAYKPKILNLKIGEKLLVPWDAFVTSMPKDKKERAVSNGTKTWIMTPTTFGIEVRRIE